MKNFFSKLGDRMRSFMYGRYGYDQFNYFLVWGAIVLMVLASLAFRNYPVIYTVVDIIAWAMWIFGVIRSMSTNHYKRSLENEKFLQVTKPIRNRIKCMKKQRKDSYNKYYVCPKCAQIVRVPKGRGKITVTCPSCHASFDKKS